MGWGGWEMGCPFDSSCVTVVAFAFGLVEEG